MVNCEGSGGFVKHYAEGGQSETINPGSLGSIRPCSQKSSKRYSRSLLPFIFPAIIYNFLLFETHVRNHIPSSASLSFVLFSVVPSHLEHLAPIYLCNLRFTYPLSTIHTHPNEFVRATEVVTRGATPLDRWKSRRHVKTKYLKTLRISVKKHTPFSKHTHVNRQQHRVSYVFGARTHDPPPGHSPSPWMYAWDADFTTKARRGGYRLLGEGKIKMIPLSLGPIRRCTCREQLITTVHAIGRKLTQSIRTNSTRRKHRRRKSIDFTTLHACERHVTSPRSCVCVLFFVRDTDGGRRYRVNFVQSTIANKIPFLVDAKSLL